MKKLLTVNFEKGKLFLMAVGLVMLSSCGSDDAAPSPVAAFDYDADGLVVTFINRSTNATTYLWDFGDGETSTEESPVHEYASYGEYTTRLTSTGDGGTDSSDPDLITLSKSSPVVVDGVFTEWESIATASVSEDGNGGSIDIMKVDYDAQQVYIYLKGDLNGVFGLFINADNDITTGATTPNFDYLWQDLGADYYIEGNYVDWGTFFQKDPSDPDWLWIDLGASSAVITSSQLIELSDGKAIEFSVLRSGLPGISSEEIGLAIKDIDANWNTAGGLPPLTLNEIPGVVFKLDLTK